MRKTTNMLPHGLDAFLVLLIGSSHDAAAHLTFVNSDDYLQVLESSEASCLRGGNRALLGFQRFASRLNRFVKGLWDDRLVKGESERGRTHEVAALYTTSVNVTTN